MDRLSRKQIITAGILLVCFSLLLFWGQKKITHHSKHYSIGLVWVPSRAFQEQLGTSIMNTIKNDKRFSFKEFSAPSTADLITLNAICETALDSDADLLLCIGFNCAKSLAQLSKKRLSKKPIVFTGLNEAVSLGIVDSLEQPGGSVTGIYDAGLYNTGHPITIFLTAKPDIKSIIMPYVITADSNEQHVYMAQKIAADYGVQVTPFPIDKFEDTMMLINGVIDRYDAIMYLEADRLSVYGSSIGKLASEYGVTLFACSPDAKDTAAFTYYAEFIYIAEAAYALIKRILINKENPAITPIIKLTSSRVLTINVNRCREQGMSDIDPLKIMHAINSNPQLTEVHNRITINNMNER
jgi:ABC-type uncharacterized transport system substrate-binding protein